MGEGPRLDSVASRETVIAAESDNDYGDDESEQVYAFQFRARDPVSGPVWRLLDAVTNSHPVGGTGTPLRGILRRIPPLANSPITVAPVDEYDVDEWARGGGWLRPIERERR